MSTPLDSPVQSCPSKKEDNGPLRKHFAKFKLIDDENNTPIEGVVVEIDLADGNNRTNSTNDKGEVEFADLDSGTLTLYSNWRELIKMGVTVLQTVFIE
jgi:hypothetical protein